MAVCTPTGQLYGDAALDYLVETHPNLALYLTHAYDDEAPFGYCDPAEPEDPDFIETGSFWSA